MVNDFLVDPYLKENQLALLIMDGNAAPIDFPISDLEISDKDVLLFKISTNFLLKQTFQKLRKMFDLIL
jgi:hypothetical protein